MAIKKSDVRQAKLMLKVSEKYTKRYTRILKSSRAAIIEKVVKEYERTEDEDVIKAITEPYLKPLIRQLYMSVAAEIGTLQLGMFGQKANIEKQSWYKKVVAYIDSEIGEKVTTISNTFKDDFLRTIKFETVAAQAENLGINAIANKIGAKMTELLDWQALRIAQTEVLSAASVAQNESVKSVGVPYQKTWMAAMINTRHSHKAMHGVTAKNDGMFVLPDGSKMEYPRDARFGAPAGEIINCQCFVIYEPKRDW